MNPLATCLAFLLVACGGGQTRSAAKPDAAKLAGWKDETTGSSRARASAPAVAIVNATLWTAAGEPIAPGTLVLSGGRIEAVGKDGDVQIPKGAKVIDAKGAYVTPGIIDTHSHMGVYAVPGGVTATDDGNEATDPVTAQVWAGDSFWPQDPSLRRALAAGVTTIQVLPGSANLIGGRGAIVKLRPGLSVSEMRFPWCARHAQDGLRREPEARLRRRQELRALHAHGQRGRLQEGLSGCDRVPALLGRLEEEARQVGREARSRIEPGQRSEKNEGRQEVGRRRKRGAHAAAPRLRHGDPRRCPRWNRARADALLPRRRDGADDGGGRGGFGFKCARSTTRSRPTRSATSSHDADISISTWTDWWGFKLEAFDAIPENLGLLTQANVRGVLHSDSAMLVQRLNQEVGKAVTFAARARGIAITDDQALRWITANAAWTLGIEDRVGTLEAGADVVIWEGYPLSYQSHAAKVFVDGELLFERGSEALGHPQSDFELGWFEQGGAGQGSGADSKESK
jgi:hypothetical protein